MEYDKIKQLMEDMGKSNIEELEIEFPEGMKISMKKNVAVVPAQQVVAQQSTNIPVVQSIQTTQPIQEEPKEEYKEIKSPMVGTFYSKPSPDKEEFVKVGDKVKKGQVVCIIEAMKLMNEIEAEFDGEVVEVCLNDGDAVEYGKPLFKLK
jgi:acetyl-coA carboxylase, biotin carboxyl carrier protein